MIVSAQIVARKLPSCVIFFEPNGGLIRIVSSCIVESQRLSARAALLVTALGAVTFCSDFQRLLVVRSQSLPCSVGIQPLVPYGAGLDPRDPRSTRPAIRRSGITNSVNPSCSSRASDAQHLFSGVSYRTEVKDPLICTCTRRGSSA